MVIRQNAVFSSANFAVLIGIALDTFEGANVNSSTYFSLVFQLLHVSLASLSAACLKLAAAQSSGLPDALHHSKLNTRTINSNGWKRIESGARLG